MLGTATLLPQGDAAVATLTSATFAAGTHQIGAAYAGSSVPCQPAPPQFFLCGAKRDRADADHVAQSVARR